MAWHLKDRELEKKLIEMCPNFIECIEDAIQTKEKDTNYIYVEFDRERECDTLGFNYLYFWDDELEEIHEYNPHGWNEYPKVKPPYNVMMRVETYFGQGYKLSYNHFNDGDFWCDPNCILMSGAFSDDVTRFRPWED